MSNRIQVIDYEIVNWDDLASDGETGGGREGEIGVIAEVGILHCTAATTKVTLIGTADAARALLASGRASKPGGLVISKEEFPVLIQGWPNRFGPPYGSFEPAGSPLLLLQRMDELNHGG